jgi:hypothetical protein
METSVFWVVTPCISETARRFGGTGVRSGAEWKLYWILTLIPSRYGDETNVGPPAKGNERRNKKQSRRKEEAEMKTMFEEMDANQKTKKLNSVAVVRKRTIPTERPPLVGEVSANLCG